MAKQNKGWIMLHRKLLDSKIFKSKSAVPTKVWIAMLLSACHEAYSILRSNGEEVTLKCGEFAFGRNAWAKRLNIAPGTLRNTLSCFRSYNRIEDKLVDNHQPSIYKIKNWELYQQPDRKVDRQPDNTPDTNNNVYNKNVNNKAKKPTIYFSDSLKNEAYRLFISQFALKRKYEASPDKPINNLTAYCRALANSELRDDFNAIYPDAKILVDYEAQGGPYPRAYGMAEDRLQRFDSDTFRIVKKAIEESGRAGH